MKLGIEVEGKYKGIPSIFIDDSEIDSLIEKLNKNEIPKKYVHIYISDLKDLNDVRVVELSKNYIITVEIDDLKCKVPNHINHLMLRIKNSDDIMNLRPTDSIKIHTADNFVFSASIENMFITHPADFDNDIEIKE